MFKALEEHRIKLQEQREEALRAQKEMLEKALAEYQEILSRILVDMRQDIHDLVKEERREQREEFLRFLAGWRETSLVEGEAAVLDRARKVVPDEDEMAPRQIKDHTEPQSAPQNMTG